jgi:diguanylate cyclase (GGDEF)-like protein
MSDAALDNIDYARYARILRQALDSDFVLAVCDRTAVPAWVNDESRADLVHAGLTLLHERGFLNETNTTAIPPQEIKPGIVLYCNLLGTDAAGITGWIVVILNQAALDQGHKLGRITWHFADIAASIGIEYAINSELNAMAFELGERYEELNLVYRTENWLKSPADGSHGYQQLISECGKHLKFDGFALILPSQRLYTRHLKSNSEDHELKMMLSYLETPFYEAVCHTKTSVVINRAEDWRLARIATPVHFKALASPIVDALSRVCGVLFALNHTDKPDFLTSDRQLMEVVAKRISRMVQTSQDDLTGLFNPDGFNRQIEYALRAAEDLGNSSVLLTVDLDKFEIINETYGHSGVGQCLKHISMLLLSNVRPSDAVARLGGNKFGILLKDCALNEGQEIAERICHAIEASGFEHKGIRSELGASLGLVEITEHGGPLSKVLSEAESACGVARDLGGNRVFTYQENDAALTRYRGDAQWVSRINQAITENRFVLFCQAIAPLAKSGMHYELLLRYADEDGGLLPPGLFMPAAERYHMMPALDRWVVRTAFATLANYSQRDECRDIVWSINLSGQSLGDESLLSFVDEQFAAFPQLLKRICFEITETAAIENLSIALNFINSLRARGCRFSLDDFGSGLSSFSYLKKIPVDYLKMDGCFTRDILTDPLAFAMMRSINEIGHAMGLETIAEFVENQAILDKLKELGLDYAQGYAIGKPQPLVEVLDGLTESRPAQRLAHA